MFTIRDTHEVFGWICVKITYRNGDIRLGRQTKQLELFGDDSMDIVALRGCYLGLLSLQTH